ncbi:4-hydroxythreonine-4-phosphate dehydrogenase PdxA [Endozoicomonas sp. GU-1]|uniref:4-hydroxythreonine-4-phosphate dehydrogenase PdxA n=1 Tax=Endozoicomonas sp. GU-1 TaxID=3009078 RepID=UPI0022B4BABE|nr:4-hydroxythreonine-4-phosphate dehydrogenase PdxA [Endozoicomonas sp. GU-1]WBA82011.1 4-hydroxythreonine-4-phosphate dehydrogenase PdxA [Endozoicomonas sp. GU-1]WBA84957.1 4-hydroxythreonine-4-phosphate dehydrogenase PdxA [Endozoicomonas sp. GU-1]
MWPIAEMPPLICIPMGDPAGIGAEIIIKSLCDPELAGTCRPVVLGDVRWLEQAASLCREKVSFRLMQQTTPDLHQPGQINLLDSPITNIDHIMFGKTSAASGAAAYQFIERAVHYVQQQKKSAIVTPPINKLSLKAAKIPHIGHTEILASLTHTHDPITLFQVAGLRVFFLTRHLSLRQACDAIVEDRVFKGIVKSYQILKSLGIPAPSLAVAGLNPHCGENGLFGDEEVCAIEPAVMRARKAGWNITGPIPADSVFHQALNGAYDGVLSMYHDQGHIATKMVDFQRTVSITCGLPFLRTSVDHGTAYDIAGTGQASEVSLTEAIKVAVQYTDGTHRNQ